MVLNLSFFLSTFVTVRFLSALCTATIQTVIKCIIVIMCVEFERKQFVYYFFLPGPNNAVVDLLSIRGTALVNVF